MSQKHPFTFFQELSSLVQLRAGVFGELQYQFLGAVLRYKAKEDSGNLHT